MQTEVSASIRLTIYLLTAVIFVLSGVETSMAAFGDASENRQIRIGLKIFRAVMAADKNLPSKAKADGTLDILLIHKGNRDIANKFGDELRAMGQGAGQGNIRGLSVKIKSVRPNQLNKLAQQPAGLFIIEPLDKEQLTLAIDYCIKHNRLLYSPFNGDVERGVMAGLAIETRVRPYVNQASLAASSINLKTFFFRVAKIYEP